ncbi:hypothetical protein DN069_09560 [Streptacidiphilus pinicola]|uniref:Uncharacterized protein n=1 Tax=Streptacidiphilus pinicola TaxID=2219663 RepID=A0A2X0JDM7_9ACTN|nr:hypothetical protein [Streptacidiphilus pinicola]RAG85748.1 hypothetical protein DN069_09560 [Streptacidiphilus pinicola]
MVINPNPPIPTDLSRYPVCRLGSWVLVPDRWNTDGEKRAGYLWDGSGRVTLAYSCDLLVEFVQALHRVEDNGGSARAVAV